MEPASSAGIAVIGIVATLAVAAITGLIKLVKYSIEVAALDRQARFDQRVEVARLVLEAETRLSMRLDKSESQLYELRLRIARRPEERSHDGNSL